MVGSFDIKNGVFASIRIIAHAITPEENPIPWVNDNFKIKIPFLGFLEIMDPLEVGQST
jgi:hypothetical protein